MVPPASGRLHHEALFFDEDHTLMAAAMAFVRAGVQRGEAVVVSANGNPAASLLRARFGEDPAVKFATEPLYLRPVDVVGHYKRIVEQSLSRGVPGIRLMGHLDLDKSDLPWQEWVRYEAAFTRLFADYPVVTLCPWDTRVLSPEQADALYAAHPRLLDLHTARANAAYVEPEELVARPELTVPTDPLQQRQPDVELWDVDAVSTVRGEVYPAVFATELPAQKADGFVKALGEVAANAWVHGVRPVVVRVWAGSHRVVATVTDHGRGLSDPFLGYLPAPGGHDGADSTGGLGLWAARLLCDLVDYRRSSEGFTVRLVTSA